MIEQPYNGRAKIESDSMTLKITIPSKKNWFLILFLFFWMGGWFMGESSAISGLMKSGEFVFDAFMVIWLAGWTFGGLFALVIIVWSLLGRETVTIDSSVWQIEKGIFDFSFTKKQYEINSIKKLELSPEKDEDSIFQQKKIGDFWGITGGRVYFDYGMKTVKFAIGVDNAEARYIIEEIKKRSFYKDKD